MLRRVRIPWPLQCASHLVGTYENEVWGYIADGLQRLYSTVPAHHTLTQTCKTITFRKQSEFRTSLRRTVGLNNDFKVHRADWDV